MVFNGMFDLNFILFALLELPFSSIVSEHKPIIEINSVGTKPFDVITDSEILIQTPNIPMEVGFIDIRFLDSIKTELLLSDQEPEPQPKDEDLCKKGVGQVPIFYPRKWIPITTAKTCETGCFF